MSRRLWLIGWALLWGVVPSAAQAQIRGHWESVAVEDGISVDRRTVDGFQLYEFRGRTVFNEKLVDILAVLRDAPRRVEWMDRCVEAKVLERPEPLVEINYTRVSAPIIDDRDAVAQGKVVIDEKRRAVKVLFREVTHPKEPPRDGVVRMPRVRGHWILRPYEDGLRTHVEYQAYGDPGGSLPDFIVNLASESMPLVTLQRLRAQVKAKRGKYPEVVAHFYKDPRWAIFWPPELRSKLAESNESAPAGPPLATPSPAPATEETGR